MKKDITICFRTSREIKRSIDTIAEMERQTVSSVIETIIYNHLKEKKAIRQIEQERRQYNRKQVSLPAFILEKNSDSKELKTGMILDISLGGLQISIPQSANPKIVADCDEMKVVFTLPEAPHPITVKCKPYHVEELAEDVRVGTAFVDSDFKSYQTLQRYLI